LLFEVTRFAGAAYLIWLGIQLWRNAGRGGPVAPARGRAHAMRGFLVALSNPKTAASSPPSCRSFSFAGSVVAAIRAERLGSFIASCNSSRRASVRATYSPKRSCVGMAMSRGARSINPIKVDISVRISRSFP
jgi:hypothetical protein